MAQEHPRNACHTCKTLDERTFSCIQCNNLAFCDQCWSQWVLHAPGAVGWDSRPHEKSNPQVVQRLRQILEPSRTESDHNTELQDDDDTTWFGVGRDSSNQPVFRDYGRFATLMSMSESANQEPGSKYPQLVSFIGQTGAGKSTLIKMLIDRLEMSDKGMKYPSPVTSSNNDRLPTTGDVHLYADPSCYHSRFPILYADCEGLNGGENIPRGLRHRAREQDDTTSDLTGMFSPASFSRPRRPSSAGRATIFLETQGKRTLEKMRKCRHGSQRDIVWAVTPETKKREYAVTQLYPRLLYTFSDVVVFVLRNPRAFESTVLEKLLEWGSASIDKSLNQPALPHAIIVLNATENVDDKEWDTETATNLLLEDIRGAIFREPRFEELARIWRDSGRRIETTKDLLGCYYASITVVRIPSRGRYMLMDQQASKLFDLVKKRCQASHLTKRRVRMLATAEKLQTYLQAAYDHFSRDLDTPFDFIKEALKHNPIPRDFGGNILKLALSIKRNSQQAAGGNTEKIFDKMVPMISSCIMLDCVRQNLMGTTIQLLNDAYVEFCEGALEEFANLYTDCSFVHSKYGRCCNKKSGHDPKKGHQNRLGKIIGAGGYQSDLDPQEFCARWTKKIRLHLGSLQSKLQEMSHNLRDMTEKQVAAELHLNLLNDFYRGLGNVSDFISHSACFSCLRELPEHALPCGHILCSPCVNAYGRKVSRTSIELGRCPLHRKEMLWDPPWTVSIKPPYAGTRILCLDGGGVRGIVELQVLRAIEKILGPKLSIQDFFDLIVGTSTGGIIALGLGVNNWPVDDCISTFKQLCREAFTRRELVGIPVLEKLAILHHGSMYRTKPFEKLLKEKFESRPLFGGPNEVAEMVTKVAITSTTAVAQHAVVIANYNRPEDSEYELPYQFLRSDGPTKEFKIWEAARATSAAPPFFKAFLKNDTQSSYLDGALYHNCPVWVAHHERKLIWGDVADSVPDIILSVGTGINSLDGDGQLPRRSTRPSVDNSIASPTSQTKPKSSNTFLPMQLWNIAADRFDQLLECNSIWQNFVSENSSSDFARGNQGNHRRFIRLNPDLRSKIPRLDAVDELSNLEKATEDHLRQNMARIKEVAHRLVASSFFFEKDHNSVKQITNGFECTGRIHCRFTSSSDEMKALGEFLRSCLGVNFEPYFVIKEDGNSSEEGSRITMREDVINDMYLRGSFSLGNIRIQVSKELSSTNIYLCLQTESYPSSTNAFLPISGFPRELIREDSQDQSPLPRSKRMRRSGEYRNMKTQRFQSFRDRMPSISDKYDAVPRSHLRCSKSQVDLRDTYQGLPREEMPQTPNDVGKWAQHGDISHNLYELE